MTRPLIIGLTGSIGMGKSTVAAMFEAAGVPVFDADRTVRTLQGPGGALVPAIEAAFPGSTGPGGVDRDELGKRVFGNKAELARLEAIVHPAVGEARAEFLRENQNEPIVVFDVPLLFETGGDSLVDLVVVVSAPPQTQAERVLARPGMTREKFDHILSLQVPDAQKRAKAHHIIDTATPLEATREAVIALVNQLKRRQSRIVD